MWIRNVTLSICCVLLMSLMVVAAVTAEPVSQRCYNNTVAIAVPNTLKFGSGFLFTRKESTFIWTAGHVAEMGMNSNGTFRDLIIIQDDKLARARVIRCGDPYVSHDIALLQVIEGNLKGDTQFYRAFNEVKLGQKIIHCGNPFNIKTNGNLLFYGNVSHVGRTLSVPVAPVEREVDQCEINAYPGCSGGPIFDAETGDVLGIVSLGGTPGLTVIVPTRFIYEWAKSHDCLWAFDSEVPVPAEIVPWRADVLARLIKNRVTSGIDSRWGESAVQSVPAAPEPTLAPKPVLELPILIDIPDNN